MNGLKAGRSVHDVMAGCIILAAVGELAIVASYRALCAQHALH